MKPTTATSTIHPVSDTDRKNHILVDEARALIEKGNRMIETETGDIRRQLSAVIGFVSLSYIADTYFGKSRTWLYQRINGNTVNGKPVFFTKAERRRLQEALHDIAQKLLAVSLT